MGKIYENVFTSGSKYANLHSGDLRYADFKKIGNHLIGSWVPAKNWGLKWGGGGRYFRQIFKYDNNFNSQIKLSYIAF